MSINLEQAWQIPLERITGWTRVNSPWAIHFNGGLCNGCDIEILAALTPRYADILICIGPVTRQAHERLQHAAGHPCGGDSGTGLQQ